MSGKLRLAKTKDSRTRKQPVKAVNVAEAEKLKQELKSQQKFTEYLLLKGYSTNTTKCYVKDAEIFIQWAERENVPIESVSYSDVLHYIQGRRNNVKQRTISINVNSIKHYFNFLSLTPILPTKTISPIFVRIPGFTLNTRFFMFFLALPSASSSVTSTVTFK